MKSCRLLWVGVCIAGACGCKSAPPSHAQLSTNTNQASIAGPVQPVATAQPAPTAPSEPSAQIATPATEATASRDAVAARARKYAQEMERAIGQPPTVTEPVAPKPVAKLEAEAPPADWTRVLKGDGAPAASAVDSRPSQNSPGKIPAPPVVEAAVGINAPNHAAVAPPAVSETVTPSPTIAANTTVTINHAGELEPAIVPEGQEFGDAAPSAPAVTKSGPKMMEDASLAEQLARRVKENPRDVSAHLDYQLYQFTLGQSVPQLAPLAPLPTEDREVVAALMDGLSNFRTSLQADGNQLLSKKIRPLVDLSDRLKAQADLAVPTIALCRRVDGFGVYDPIEPADFPKGRETPVILYCEVANFGSQKSGPQWETTLAHSATLYKESGVPVWSDKTTNVADHSRNRRHDFFVVKMLKLPPTLSAGRYVLKVTVVDRQSNRMAEGSTTLTVGGADGVAKSE